MIISEVYSCSTILSVRNNIAYLGKIIMSELYWGVKMIG